ncbi:MAG: hypothetical protein HOW73_34865 [Polyangiaceae bacterium]|nr:hypothetical protein [Polyangiaceae bacterium]
MAQQKSCGKHTELASNESVRVTQCPCGTVHLTFAANGVTLRLPETALKNVTRAVMTALDKVEERQQAAIN